MNKRILILESDKGFAAHLKQILRRINSFTVTAVAAVNEACHYLKQNRHDLAFIPLGNNTNDIRSLRAVQPDLRLILVTPTADEPVPMIYLGQVQGVLIKSLVEVELPMVLEGAINQPLPLSGVEEAAPAAGESLPLDMATIKGILQQAKLGRLVQTVIFADGPHLLAHWGELTKIEAATIALRVAEGIDQAVQPTRLQFWHLPARAGDLLLFTRHVAENYRLTLVALPETPLNELRSRANKTRAPLIKAIRGRTAPLAPGSLETGYLNRRTSYAIVWRPVRPLPASLHIPLRRALERLSVANACILTHTLVRAELVHVVATCPPGRDSVWAAYLFKNGSEQIIQQQFGVAATLWEKGFYAVESADPLSTAELNIFLERDSSS